MFVQECLMAERADGRPVDRGAIDSPSPTLPHLHDSRASLLGTALHKRVGRPSGSDHFRQGDKLPLLLTDLRLFDTTSYSLKWARLEDMNAPLIYRLC